MLVSCINTMLDKTTMNKTRQYSLKNMNFGFVRSLYSEVESTIIPMVFAMPWLWGTCDNILSLIGLDNKSEILQSLLFVFIFSVYGLITG